MQSATETVVRPLHAQLLGDTLMKVSLVANPHAGGADGMPPVLDGSETGLSAPLVQLPPRQRVAPPASISLTMPALLKMQLRVWVADALTQLLTLRHVAEAGPVAALHVAGVVS